MIKEGNSFRAVGLSDLRDIARGIAGQLEECTVWLFYGEMGSGKTTLIKEICKAAGVVDTMSSPTYAIINEYETLDQTKVFHFDFYRIKHEAEAYDIGVEEYFYSGCPCFIEWPEKIPSLIPSQYAEVAIQVEDKTLRNIVISFHDGKEENRV